MNKHKDQQAKAMSYKEPVHDIPGDYTTAPGSVPSLPGGIEKFTSASKDITELIVGYLSVLTGVSCLFIATIRLSTLSLSTF